MVLSNEATEIAAVLLILRQRAIEHDRHFLAYLIEMARLEAAKPFPEPDTPNLAAWAAMMMSREG